MTPTRPQSVPQDAALFYTDQTFPPGLGVQNASIKVTAAVFAQINARAEFNYHRALADWHANEPQNAAYHLPNPPQPLPPPIIETKVVYANLDGTVVDTPEGANGQHYAWCWGAYA